VDAKSRVGVDAAISAQLLDVGGVDNPEIEAKLFQHLDAPLLLQRCGADDQDSAGTVPQQHLLDDETGLDGLAQADVVGDEQIDAGHVDGAYQRVELEVLDADTAAERRLQKSSVGIGGCTPTDRIKEGFEGVESSWPVIEGRPARSMICAPGSISQMTSSSSPRPSSSMDESVTQFCCAEVDVQLGRGDIRHDPLAPTNLDQLARFGAGAVGLAILSFETSMRPTVFLFRGFYTFYAHARE
jgi:hypothetical protein